MPDLLQIETFLEVSRCLSFAEASRRLGLPRSTVTARVGALEARLNCRLLHRTTRTVSLTEEGRAYAARCAEAIDVLRQAEDDLALPSAPSGTIRLSVPLDFPKKQLARCLAGFCRQYPAVALEVDVSDVPVDFLKDNIDVALRGGAPGASDLVARRIGAARMALFSGSPEDLRGEGLDHRFLFDPTGSHPRGNYEAPPVRTRNFELAKALAREMGGLVFLPEATCIDDEEAGRLFRLPGGDRPDDLPLFLVLPTRKHVPMRVRTFVDYLASELSRSGT